MKRIRWPSLCLAQTHSKLVLFLICTLFILLVGATVALVHQAEAAGTLPPFQMDTTLPDQIVLNPEQGLGQCHWVDPYIVLLPYVSWAYDASTKVSGWCSIEPQSGLFYWGAIDADIEKARKLGKRIWLEVLTTEGMTPQWAVDAGVQLVGSRGGTPVPWNETYQRLLRRVVHAMAARYDGNPTVEAIVMMAGGCYGEMTICNAKQDEAAWLAAGYTDARFVEAVKKIIDIYLEEEYVWEDGSRSHGFLKTPVVLQLGAGLYGMEVTRKPVVDYAMGKYGMRVWLKFNGLGGPGKVDEIYAEFINFLLKCWVFKN
ncbi:MAG: beta-galactosidase [Anaerolineae bacterium]